MELDEEALKEFSSEFEENNADVFPENKDLIELSQASSDVKKPEKVHLECLQKYFGHTSFRTLQWKIINAIMTLKQDICAVMATGYGKSLCYQFPAVFTGGITIVVSPLISLMEDQVISLTVSNIPACLLGSAQTNSSEVKNEILQKKYRVVYLTPEFACGETGTAFLKEVYRIGVTLIAIDEAHCVSSWGHDFRFQYRQLKILKDIFPDVPFLAVTATATPVVRKDIVNSLKMRNPLFLCSGFDRPNLYFAVYKRSTNSIMENLRRARLTTEGARSIFNSSTIIYTITRKMAEDVAGELRVQGIKCACYHAGLSIKKRKEVHEAFVKDEIKVIAATIAFGMGIDKPDVRNVVHFGSSRDIESYYQEVGRAGRDGLPSKCVLIYCSGDFNLHDFLMEKSKKTTSNPVTQERYEQMTSLMKEYLRTNTCRRVFILKHFEGREPDTTQNEMNCCDNCDRQFDIVVPDHLSRELNEGKYNLKDDYEKFLTALSVVCGKTNCGMKKVVSFLVGKTKFFAEHSRYGLGKNKSARWWEEIGRLLELRKYIETFRFKARVGTFSFPVLRITDKGKQFLTNPEEVWEELTMDMYEIMNCKKVPLVPVAPMVAHSSHSQDTATRNPLQPKSTRITIEDVEGKDLYRRLLNKRSELARDHECMPYMVASNEALMNMSIQKPYDIDQLRNLKLDGFTEVKIQKFAGEFLKIINNSSCTPETLPSVKELLAKHPATDACCSIICNMFQSGFSISDIAKMKSLPERSVWMTIAQGIRSGYELPLSTFGITDEMKKTVIEVILSHKDIFLSTVPDMDTAEDLKNLCPLDIETEKVLLIWSYLQLREHLKNLNVKFVDFDPIDRFELKPETAAAKDNLTTLLNVIEQMDESMPKCKKIKACHLQQSADKQNGSCADLLNSENEERKMSEISTLKTETSNSLVLNVVSKKNSNKLPPWLRAKK